MDKISGSMVIVYFAVIFFMSLYMSRKNNQLHSFLVAKRELGCGLIIVLLFAELIAGSSTVGSATEAYDTGISAVWLVWGTATGVLITVVFALKFFRVMALEDKMSVPEIFAYLFDDKVRIVLMSIILIVYTIIFSLQPVAVAGLLSPMFGISTQAVVIGGGVFFILIALGGGLKSLARLNAVNSMVMYFGLGIAFILVLNKAGGFSALSGKLTSDYFNLALPGPLNLFSWLVGTAIQMPVASLVVAGALGAKSYKTSTLGMTGAALLIIPFALFPVFIGMSAKVLEIPQSGNNVIFAVTQSVHPILAGITSMAIIAAILSTAPALLLMIGGSLTRDLYVRFIRPDSTDRQQMMFTRISIVIVGVLGIVLGLNTKSILSNLLGAFQIRTIAGLVLLLALWWPRVDATAAFWSILVGGGLAAFWHFADKPFGLEPAIPSMVVGFLILLVLTLTRKKGISEGYRKYRLALERHRNDL